MVVIEGRTVSEAWLNLVAHALRAPKGEISPAVVSMELPSQGMEDAPVRHRLDHALSTAHYASVATVANTIFPSSIWTLAGGDRHRFYELYRGVLPRIRAAEPQLNRGGLYFERMFAWGSGPCGGNQLEFIISQHRSGRRRTAYQVSVFDPARDHSTTPRQGFPCLQHVSFLPDSNGLRMNAFYATQRIFDKAYGNYLGLLHLGRFVAQGLMTEFNSLTCYVGVAKLGVNKGDAALRHVVA